MEEKLERMNAWFDAQIAACAKQRETLLADDRADEADFEKIKANIYDIFRMVLKTAAKESKGDNGAANAFSCCELSRFPPPCPRPTRKPSSTETRKKCGLRA